MSLMVEHAVFSLILPCINSWVSAPLTYPTLVHHCVHSDDAIAHVIFVSSVVQLDAESVFDGAALV